MLEVQDHTQGEYKRGAELPFNGAKLVLETTELEDPQVAIAGYNRDPKGHRPHYVVDPVGYNIYKLSDSQYSVIGSYDPTQPQRTSRCVFVAIYYVWTHFGGFKMDISLIFVLDKFRPS